jgi:hypothetical protein
MIYILISITIIILGIMSSYAEIMYSNLPIFGYHNPIINQGILLSFFIGLIAGIVIKTADMPILTGLLLFALGYFGAFLIFKKTK